MTDHHWPAKLLTGAAIGVTAALFCLLLARTAVVERLELASYDWRTRLTARSTQPSDAVVIVAMNDDSIQRLESVVGRWPWPRLVHAHVVDFLARGGAKLVVYDGLFTERDIRRFDVDGQEWTGSQSDRAFAESVAKAGNVVLGADAKNEGLVDATKQMVAPLDNIPSLPTAGDATGCAEPRPLLIPPYAELAQAARAIGHTYTILDDDGPVRRTVPFVRVGERTVPSLAIATTAAAGQAHTKRTPLLHERIALADGGTATACRALIPYRGPSFNPDGPATFREFSFYSLFYSEQQILAGEKPELDPAIFRDKIVVIGATASGTHDIFTSPFGLVMPGAEIHANIIDGLLGDRTIAPMSAGRAGAVAIAGAVIVGASGALGSIWLTGLVAGGLAAAAAWWSVQQFASGTWMPLVMPLLALALAFVGQLAWQYFVEGREKRQVKRLFSRYVPKDVYEQLLADPDRAALGGRRRTMTVLFSDVRGFTAMSERATPEEVVGQLNEYFSRMVQVLFAHRGTLDKFVGDMVMGLFGAPLDDSDHAEHAVQAALAMTTALEQLNAGWAAAGRPVLDIGIGISTGEMVAGNIGSDTIMSYTVIGDAVNLGARLESLNKDYGSRIIISEATRAALKGRYDMRPLGEVVVKGKSRPVAIYEVKSS
ncbi:MAG TPA: adenylate/guanylate cyclase domain-containing protein [Vicinamibacterales bacterium]|nr:adenylate/guanylate cyclase domain-containing protein [Vicinamibacterales bacterium]